MITQASPVVRASRGAPAAASVLVCADLADGPGLVAQVVDAVAQLGPVLVMQGPATDARLQVRGARIRVVVAQPAWPEMYPSATMLLTGIVEDPGNAR